MSDTQHEAQPQISGSTSLTDRNHDDGMNLEETAQHFADELGIHEASYTPAEKPAEKQAGSNPGLPFLYLMGPEAWDQLERDLPATEVLKLRKVSDEQAAAHAELLRQETAKLEQLVPSWKDPATRRLEQRAIWQYARENGYSDDELTMLSAFGSARDVAQLRRAWKQYESETGPDPRLSGQAEQPRDPQGKYASPSKNRGVSKATQRGRSHHQRPGSLDEAAARFEEIL